jgi:hypothetical protein
LAGGEVTVRVVEQKLQELVLALGQPAVASAVADHRPLGIEAKALEIPEALVPQVEPTLVAGHLTFDDGQVG